jgi:DNA-binding MarR family transcriptional regulator
MRPLTLIPAIHRAAHAIGTFLEADRELPVTQAEAHVLAHLAAHGDSTVGQIHLEFGHKRSTLTSILNRLEARGLITCRVNESDRRSFLIGLTPGGQMLARDVLKKLSQVEEEVLEAFRPADGKNALGVLGAVTSSLEGRLDEPQRTQRTLSKNAKDFLVNNTDPSVRQQ